MAAEELGRQELAKGFSNLTELSLQYPDQVAQVA